jgi:protein O-mannosyl-transferase
MKHLARKMSATTKKQPVFNGRKPSQPALRWQLAGICLVLAAMSFAVFGQTLRHEFVNFDDGAYVYYNAKVAGGLSLKGLAWVFTHADCASYHPLTMLSLMADYQLHGLHAGGYHFTNVALHTASVILLFLVLRQMTGALWRSAFVAAVFAIHPLRVESVAWVAERKDVLSAFFFMLTIGAYVRYARRPWSWGRYGLVLLLFAMGLMCKPMLVTLPVVLLLLDYWPLQRVELRKLSGLVLEKLPLLALSAASCVATLLTQTEAAAIYSGGSYSLPNRLGNALASCLVYLGQMVWLAGLAVLYPFPHNGTPAWEVALAGVLLAGLSVIAWGERRTQPWLLMGWFWYLVMLLPVVGLIQVGQQAHADRYTYLPQIGIYVAVTWLVAQWRVNRVVLGGVMSGVLVVLMVCAWQQTAYWQNSETLWTHTLACTTDNEVAQYSLGNTLLQKGRVDEAIAHFQIALQIKPDNAETHYKLGNALAQKGKEDEAILHYQRALQIDPDFVPAHVNFGGLLLQRGKVDEAIAHFQKALEIKPDLAPAHDNLGNALLQKGRASEAITHFQKALQINPANPTTQNNLAWLLATCPQASLRNGDKAVELARQANELSGGKNPAFLGTLAAAFAEAGRFGDAVPAAQKAMALARATGQQGLAEQLDRELKQYEAGLPFHQ